MAFAPYPNEVYTTFSFLGFIMCMIPLPWHLKAWNGGTCLYMFWVGIGCLIFFINSIVWHGNAFNPTPIWCDICGKILVGSSIGIPASSLCINRRLYLLQLNPAGNAAITKSDKRRALATDLGITVGLPILIMVLHYIPQGHRFKILEDIGCYPHTYNTWVAVIMINVPPVLVSATYSFRTVISINKKRTQFNELLSQRLNVTSSLYFRLMGLAGIEVFITVPIAISFIYNVTMNRMYPWISWEATHFAFYDAGQYPASVWHSLPDAMVIGFSRWFYILCAVIFFSFFGFAEEARFHYRLAIKFFLKVIGIQVRQTEILAFQMGPLSQSGPAHDLKFTNKRRRADSFSTIPTISILPVSGHNEKGVDQLSPSDIALHGTQDYSLGHLGSQTGPDSPGDFLIPTTNVRVPATAVE